MGRQPDQGRLARHLVGDHAADSPRLPANHQGALPRRRPNGSVAPDPLVRMWAAAGSRDGSRRLDADRKNEPWPPGRRALCALPGLRRVRDAREAVYARSLLTTAIIGLSIPWARRGDVKALRILICAALASLMFSFTVLVVSVCLVGTIYAFHAWNERRVVRSWAGAGWIAALVVGSILTYLFMAR